MAEYDPSTADEEASPPPVSMNTGLDEAVRDAGMKALSGLDEADRAVQERRQEGIKVANRMDINTARQDELMKNIQGRTPSMSPPQYDPKKFEAPPSTYDPIQAFGSVGSLIGIIGSFASRRPMTAALGASAAAMNAYKQNDLTTYNRAFAEWKANSDLAYKKATFDHDLYRDSIDLMKSDIGASIAQMQAISAQNRDLPMQAALRTGDPQVIGNLQQTRANLITQLDKANDSLMKIGLIKQGEMEFQQNNGRPPNFQEHAEIIRKAEDAYNTHRYGGSLMNERLLAIDDEYQAKLREIETMPEGPAKDAAKKKAAFDRDERKASLSRGATTRSAYQTEEMRKLDIEESNAKSTLAGQELEDKLADITARRRAIADPLYAPERSLEKKFSETLGKKDAEYVAEVTGRGDKARRDLVEISRMESALDSGRFKTGILSGPRHVISQALQFLDIDPAEFKLGLGDAATADTLEAASNRLAASFETKMSRLTNMQLGFIRDSLPNLSRTPEGNRILIEVMKRVAEREIQARKLADEFATKYHSLRPNGKPSYFDAVDSLDKADPIITPQLHERILQGSRIAPKSWKEAFKDMGLPGDISLPSLSQNVPPGSMSVPANMAKEPDGTTVVNKATGKKYEKRGSYLVPVE